MKLVMLISAGLGALVCTVLWTAIEQHSIASPRTTRIQRDVVYAQYGQLQLRLDMYLPPESSPGRVPGIVAVHGGGWRSGSKEDYGYIAGNLASQGFVVAAIDYRLSGEATFPAAVHDAKAAVRWLRAHAASYGVNPNLIGAVGGSAGAHLVAMLATSGGVEELEGNGGNAKVSSTIQAAIAMACGCDLRARDGVGPEFVGAVTEFIGGPPATRPDAAAAASPASYVSRASAPLLLLHSRTDPLAPYDQSVEMADLYRRAGARVTLEAVDAPQLHAFWAQPQYFPAVRERMIEFFQQTLVPAH
ncbi:MAG TPA: alpha/beta hydrolase [Vicinamibacterales bacterium]